MYLEKRKVNNIVYIKIVAWIILISALLALFHYYPIVGFSVCSLYILSILMKQFLNYYNGEDARL